MGRFPHTSIGLHISVVSFHASYLRRCLRQRQWRGLEKVNIRHQDSKLSVVVVNAVVYRVHHFEITQNWVSVVILCPDFKVRLVRNLVLTLTMVGMLDWGKEYRHCWERCQLAVRLIEERM